VTDLDGLLAHIGAALPPCCPTGTDDDLDSHTTDCTAIRLYRRYLARYDRDHRRTDHMTDRIRAILRQDVTAAGLDQPKLIRDPDAPDWLLVHAHPETLHHWQKWCDLLAADPTTESYRGGDIAYLKGRYRGCRIDLAGHGVPRLHYELRREADPTLPPFGSPITS
jgi:hypothetical protein